MDLTVMGKNGAVILLVEDNDILREGIQLWLEADGFKVMPAVHGLDALRQMESALPDMIVSDITMPEMGGYAFYQALRSRPEWMAIPFIFLTARGCREDIYEGRRLGVEDYLVKPVSRQELVSVIRSRLVRSQQLMLVQLQEAYETSLIMLANAIELRDYYTRGHVERVMDYALIIACQMGWTEEALYSLKLGSILHDIGKIHIPEAILRKPGRLSEKEWELMKQHPLIGAALIKNVPYLQPALPVIRHHHERWDGTGYPDGLAGEDIPQSARIVTVADSLDAMTTARVYQQPATPEEAYTEILNWSGRFYDPVVIDAFRSAWEAVVQRMQKR